MPIVKGFSPASFAVGDVDLVCASQALQADTIEFSLLPAEAVDTGTPVRLSRPSMPVVHSAALRCPARVAASLCHLASHGLVQLSLTSAAGPRLAVAFIATDGGALGVPGGPAMPQRAQRKLQDSACVLLFWLAYAPLRSVAPVSAEAGSEGDDTGDYPSSANGAEADLAQTRPEEFDPQRLFALLRRPAAASAAAAEAGEMFLQEAGEAEAAPVRRGSASAHPATPQAGQRRLAAALLPTLRPYQAAAAAWMASRETATADACEIAPADLKVTPAAEARCSREAPGGVHPQWVRLRTAEPLYFSALSGTLTRTPPPPPPPPSGGILADEMGLGKTVELLALVVQHPWVPVPSESLHPGTTESPAPPWAGLAESCLCGELLAPPPSLPRASARAAHPPQPSAVAAGRSGRPQRIAAAAAAASFTAAAWLDNDDEDAECGDSSGDEAGGARRAAPGRRGRPTPQPQGSRRPLGRRGSGIVDCVTCGTALHAACVDAPTRGVFVCGRCRRWEAARCEERPCGATLVVCPGPILEQWRRELGRHIRGGAVSVLVYSGQPQGGAAPPVTAAELARHDVVLCSYETLRTEIHLASDPAESSQRGSLRHAKKYEVVPTPLTRLVWWRLVLVTLTLPQLCARFAGPSTTPPAEQWRSRCCFQDEAQMVETSTAAAAAMAGRLRGVHRWAVTGTPISRGAEDLYGLLVFLRAAPLADPFVWARCVAQPLALYPHSTTAALAEALRPLFWRNSKADVAAELGLPAQGCITTWLRLGPVERHWYRQQHARCEGDTRPWAARLAAGGGGEWLRTAEATKLMRPLLKLRQACDHPQVGASGLAVAGSGRILTMEAIHGHLVDKARLEAEERQRLVAMDMNALAGLAALQGDRDGAAALYRSVLALEPPGAPPAAGEPGAEEHVRLDRLQRLHTSTCLLRLLQTAPGGAPAGCAEAQALASEADSLREAYVAAAAARLAADAAELERVSAVAGADLGGADSWFLPLLTELGRPSERDRWDSLLARLGNALNDRWQGHAFAFRDAAGLQYVLVQELQQIAAARAAVVASVSALSAATERASAADVEAAGHCERCRGVHPRGLGTRGVLCRHCRESDPVFDKAEALFFGRQMENLPGVHLPKADVGQGRQSPSSCEAALRVLAAFAARGGDEERGAAKAHLEALEATRREFTRARALMLAQRAALAARDELVMATTPFRLRLPHEMPAPGRPDPVPEHLRLSVLYDVQISDMRQRFSAERAVHEEELRRARASLRWLVNLSRGAEPAVGGGAAAAADGAEIVRECPICHDSLAGEDGPTGEAAAAAGEVGVLPCGHTLCARCVMALADRAPACARPEARSIKCPSCRAPAAMQDVNFVRQPHGGGSCGTDTAAAADVGSDFAASGGAHATAMAAAMQALEADVAVAGSWGTKITAVVRRLKWLATMEPGCKVLVFSEWDDVLSVIHAALDENGLPHLRLASGRSAAAAIAQFQSQPELQALLLPVARGCNGLNLVEASHVLLVEPLMDPGAEAQAMARVNRIGQVRATVVHRFVVRATVEENISALYGKRVAVAAGAGGVATGGGAARARGGRAGLRVADVAALLKLT